MFENEFQLVKIQTYLLKVQIHCDGCARKVKKLLKKIEGVFLVSIDTEKQKVKVSGNVDCATVIRKLIKSGKHAELWSPTDKQNQNLQGLPSWLLDDEYHNLLQGQKNGVNAFKTQPMMTSDFDWSRERYLNQSAGVKSLISESNNFGATTLGNDPQFGWNEDMVPDARNMEANITSSAFPDSSNSAGHYTDFKDTGYPVIQHLLSSPAYEHYYAPFVTSNNMHHYKYNFPSKTMMNFQNLPACPAYEHYSTPLLRSNNMQQYQHNLPSPMKMNTDIPDMHAGYNQRKFDNNYKHLPRINNSWNYY